MGSISSYFGQAHFSETQKKKFESGGEEEELSAVTDEPTDDSSCVAAEGLAMPSTRACAEIEPVAPVEPRNAALVWHLRIDRDTR